MATKPRYRMRADGGVSIYTSDGLVNLVSGMGTARDKAANAVYSSVLMDDVTLMNAYTASSLARRVVDMPAEDACREWREWSAETADTSLIEAEESRLGVQQKTMRAQKLARLFGGCAMLIGDGGRNPAMPLVPERMTKGGLKYLTLLTPRELSAGQKSEDLTSDDYGNPQYWTINTAGNTGIRVHPSRLVLFYGSEPMGPYDMSMLQGWGYSALQGGLDAVQRVDAVAANILSLSYEAKVDVVKIPDLMRNLATRGDAYSTEIIRRLTLAATGKGINGTLILDAQEEYDQKSASFGTLDTILDRFMQLACAAYGIPMTLLFGMSPGGMNATGASDTRGYYDRVRVHQTLSMTPAMRVLDECLIRSALGDRPDEVHYNWRSLWQPTALEKAQVGKTLVDALVALDGMELLSGDAISAAAVTALTECGAFPGLEAAVIEAGDRVDEGEVEPLVEGESGMVADAAPRTLYVRRDVLNGDEIIAWAKSQGFKTTLAADDMHVTIAYSKAPVDWMRIGEAWQSEMEIGPGGPRLMEQFGEARVLLIKSDALAWRHAHMKEMGASWDYAEYQPHITISYDPASPDIATVTPYQGAIKLGPEIFEEVNEDWGPRESA